MHKDYLSLLTKKFDKKIRIETESLKTECDQLQFQIEYAVTFVELLFKVRISYWPYYLHTILFIHVSYRGIHKWLHFDPFHIIARIKLVECLIAALNICNKIHV